VRSVSEWRRFERGSRTGAEDQFWSVRLRGRICELRYGWIHDPEPPTEEVREYPRESAARSAVNQKIRSRLQRGWVEIEQFDATRQRALERGEPLEVTISKDPSNLDNWAVYADFLQEFEPLLGERIALGLALARAASEDARARLQASIDELERNRARDLFGVTLAGALEQSYVAPLLEFERRFGMIIGARIRDEGRETVRYDALVRALLELPLARILVELHVDPHVGTLSHMQVTEMLMARPRPTLRRLTLGCADSDRMSCRLPLPTLQTLLDRLPALERLELHGPFAGPADNATLREFKFGPRLGAPRVQLTSWRLPRLETLHLCDPGQVDWSRVELPRLERLLIDWMGQGDRLVARLARAPLLRQLRSLVLVGSDLSGEGVQTMLDHAEAFAGVPHIVILDVFADREDADRLRRRLPNVVLGVDATAEDADGMFAPSQAEYDELTRF
jgi:predicted DNA-binding WGR domain protein